MSRDTFLPFALPEIDETEHQLVREVLDSGWLTTGQKVKTFEAEFSAAVGAKHGLALNSATAAMHLALEAIGLQSGDEVIVPAYTFAATAEVVRYFNARPVLVDVGADCLDMRPDLVEAAITPRTRAIIPVHIAGLPADLDPLFDIAQRHGLALIEDAAHAFPCVYRGRRIGEPSPSHPGVRHAVCFSFYATKTITTGEGGMLCSDDDALVARARIMALHGISRDAWKRYTSEGSWFYEVVAPGFKYNMTDLAAALGLAQLAKAERMRQRRESIARRFDAAFGALSAFQTPSTRGDSVHAWHLYVLRLNAHALDISRGAFIDALKQRNIGASVHFIPLHLHPYYRDTYNFAPTDYPVALGEYERAISLPIYSKMTDRDVDDVIEAVLQIAAEHPAAPAIAPSPRPAMCIGCTCQSFRVAVAADEQAARR
jgi:dTDP-4-amino-4,6-dideoxygalactose transaminase